MQNIRETKMEKSVEKKIGMLVAVELESVIARYKARPLRF